MVNSNADPITSGMRFVFSPGYHVRHQVGNREDYHYCYLIETKKVKPIQHHIYVVSWVDIDTLGVFEVGRNIIDFSNVAQ